MNSIKSPETEKHNQVKTRRSTRLRIKEASHINSLDDLIKIGQNIKCHKSIDTVLLWKLTPYLEELNNLVGMTSLKESVFYQILYYLQGMHIKNNTEEYLHTILLGDPGMGKTTVAIIISKIYQTMGILSKNGPFRIAHRDDFIAGYLGQTAIKTTKLLNSCLGGVLFIDEVYALGSGQEDKDSFSKEAIDTLCSFLSEHPNDFCCIAAGYEKDIDKCFFAVNSGLESRFQWKHYIETYTPTELTEIFIIKVKIIDWILGVDKNIIIDIISKSKHVFKNGGRDIVNFVSKCKMAHSRRVINIEPEYKFILTREDLENGLELMKKNIKKDEIKSLPYGMYI